MVIAVSVTGVLIVIVAMGCEPLRTSTAIPGNTGSSGRTQDSVPLLDLSSREGAWALSEPFSPVQRGPCSLLCAQGSLNLKGMMSFLSQQV